MTIRRSIFIIFTLIAMPLLAVAMPTKTSTSNPAAAVLPEIDVSVATTEFLPVIANRVNRVAAHSNALPHKNEIPTNVAPTIVPMNIPSPIFTPVETPTAIPTVAPSPSHDERDASPAITTPQFSGQGGGNDNCQAITWNTYMLEIGNAYLIDVTSPAEKAQDIVHFEKRYQGEAGLTFVRYQFLVVSPKTKKVYVTNAETGSTEDIPYDASAGGVGFESGTGCTIEGLVVQR